MLQNVPKIAENSKVDILIEISRGPEISDCNIFFSQSIENRMKNIFSFYHDFISAKLNDLCHRQLVDARNKRFLHLEMLILGYFGHILVKIEL